MILCRVTARLPTAPTRPHILCELATAHTGHTRCSCGDPPTHAPTSGAPSPRPSQHFLSELGPRADATPQKDLPTSPRHLCSLPGLLGAGPSPPGAFLSKGRGLACPARVPTQHPDLCLPSRGLSGNTWPLPQSSVIS